MEGAVRDGTKGLLEALAAGDVSPPTEHVSEANSAILHYAVHMVELYGNEAVPQTLDMFSYAVGVVMGTSLAIYGNSEMHKGGGR